MSGVLLGIGTAVPDAALHQTDAIRMAGELMGAKGRRLRAVESLYAHSGVETRWTSIAEGGRSTYFGIGEESAGGPTTGDRMRKYASVAPSLAERAAVDALRNSGMDAGAITHLVTVSCTGFAAPGVDIELIGRLGLRRSVQRTHVGFMGCHGAINGLRVANAIAAGEPGSVVLLCCVEVCSVHFQYEPKNGAATANALFGDGAAACVVGGNGPGPRLASFGAVLVDDSLGEMGWVIGDHGFEMSLSAKVPLVLERSVGPWVDKWLAEEGLDRSDIAGWAIHPGGPRIVEAVRWSLGLDGSAVAASLEVLTRFGNMSSPTVLFVLERVLEKTQGRVVAMAFGPGLAGEGVLIER